MTRPTAAFQTRTATVLSRAGQLDANLGAVGIQCQHERSAARIDRRVVGDLLAAAVDALMKIALPIQQADRHERQAQIARGLAVIAGEHAQAARVDREALVPAVLGAEIGDQVPALEPIVGGELRTEVVVERRHDPPIRVREARVGGRVLENALVDGTQEQARAALDLAPQRGVERAEQLTELGIPAEPKVLGEIVEPLQRGWDAGRNL